MTYHIGVLFDNVLAVSSLRDVLTSNRRTGNVRHLLVRVADPGHS